MDIWINLEAFMKLLAITSLVGLFIAAILCICFAIYDGCRARPPVGIAARRALNQRHKSKIRKVASSVLRSKTRSNQPMTAAGLALTQRRGK